MSAPGPRLLLPHVAWDAGARKVALLETPDPAASVRAVVRDADGREVATVTGTAPVRVPGWHTGWWQTLDLTPVDRPGTYTVALPDLDLPATTMQVAPHARADALVGLLVDGFRAMRCDGEVDRADHAVPFEGDRPGTVDVHGGWYDASGDVSKYLSHLSYATYLNPQQTPLVVWALCEAHDALAGDDPRRAGLADEARHGAAFLRRMQDPAGYFYMTVFDRWTHDPADRRICAYETQDGIRTADYPAGYRQGGGMAVAALARASRLPGATPGQAQSWHAAAVGGLAHLEAHGRTYLDDGRENVIDDYCALLAAVEVARLVPDDPAPRRLAAARSRRLAARVTGDERFEGWLAADDDRQRPFTHASDEGLPVVALLAHRDLAGPDPEVDAALVRHLGHWRAVAERVPNPFRYPRHYARPVGAPAPRDQFFLPHDNESGYWWQGENARLASMAVAARRARAALALPPDLGAWLAGFADAQVDWILGRNPFDACMVQGVGRNTPTHDPEWPGVDGGVCNGITSGLTDEDDVALCPTDDPDHSWRWGEQWLPHAAWLLLAVTPAAPATSAGGG